MAILKALSYGGITAVIGMFIVFLGLTILICAVKIMGAVFASVTGNKQAKAKAEAEAAAAAAPKSASAPVAEPEPVVEEVADDSELIAVIAAAIAAFDNSGKSLVVRKVRRISGWNRSARTEQVYRF
jgi:sodium pump decarboxylase gamma subunit